METKGLKGLFSSKKAILAILLLTGATVLVGIGKMDIETWKEYSMFIFVTYAGAETVNGVAATIKGKVDEKRK